MKDIGKGLAVGLTAIAACIAVCAVQTGESLGVFAAPVAVSFFAYVMGYK